MPVDKFGRYHYSNRQSVADPTQPHNILNLRYYLSTKYNFEGRRLERLGEPTHDDDAVTKRYSDTALEILKSHLLSLENRLSVLEVRHVEAASN